MATIYSIYKEHFIQRAYSSMAEYDYGIVGAGVRFSLGPQKKERLSAVLFYK